MTNVQCFDKICHSSCESFRISQYERQISLNTFIFINELEAALSAASSFYQTFFYF
jgi:hypothetical protein